MAASDMELEFHLGETVVECEPLVKCLSLTQKINHCYRCFTRFDKQEAVICLDCRFVRYCSENCMRLDSKEVHDIECNLWRSAPFRLFCIKGGEAADLKLMLLRLHATLRTQPYLMTQPWTSGFGHSPSFEDVLKRPEVQVWTPEILADCHAMADFINELLPGDPVDVPYLIRLASVVKTKRFRILLDNVFAPGAWGLYVVPATIDHSCKPTAIFVGYGSKLRIRAIADIPKGKAPTVRYFCAHMDRAERQRILWESYNVYCRCDMCESRADVTVGYARLNFLVQAMKALHTGTVMDACNWPQVCMLNNEIVLALREIYHEYDEHVTDQFFRTLAFGIKSKVDKVHLDQIYALTCHYFLNTYGFDSPDYQAFVFSTQELFA